MATLNLNQRSGGTSTGEAKPVLPTDTYRMKCIESKMEDDTFAKVNADGTFPQKIALTFEVTVLTDEQQEAAEEAGEEWGEVRVWHRFNPYYGDVRAGGPSKFKEFLDNLVAWGLIGSLNLDAFEVESLAGIELRCSVLNYKKTMGENVGKPGNKITGFAPVRTKGGKAARNVPQPVDVSAVVPAALVNDEDLPF
jgi:hypothetical protein